MSSGGDTLFRGSSVGFESPTAERVGVTPASTDPVVATIFARHSDHFGDGVVYVASPQDLAGVEIVPGNVLRDLEREVGVVVGPGDFASRASLAVPVDAALDALRRIGIDLPPVGRSPADVQRALENTPRLSPEETQRFLDILRGGP